MTEPRTGPAPGRSQAAAPAEGWPEANHRYLVAALEVIRCLLAPGADPGDGTALEAARRALREARRDMSAPPAPERIAGALGLSGFERDMLLMCAGVELDTDFAHACAAAQGEPERTHATFALGLALLPNAHWSAISPAGPLRRLCLVDLSHPEVPTTSALRIDERMLHALVGLSCPDPRIAPLVTPLPEPGTLPPALARAARAVAARWSATGWAAPGAAQVLLHGRPVADLRAAAASACLQRELRPVCVRAADLPADPGERDLLARLCERETALDGTAWIIDTGDTGNAAGDTAAGLGQAALELAARLAAPVVVTAQEPFAGQSPGPRPVRVAVGRATAQETRAAWRQALGPAAGALGDWIDRAAGQFDLDLDTVAAAAAECLPPGGDTAVADPQAAGARLWDACRRHSRPHLEALAQHIEPRAGWEDLVLPTAAQRVLEQMTAHVRHRSTVLEDWGFAARTGRGLGTAALFHGPSGTGKTLAAEVVAGALRLDLYRVDLSQVVSKYIGETEKNLRRVFDAAETGGAVLLFDEADALFGKRSEVKDSHDRYANIEVGYLLQRIEAYRGLAVLTTNLKDTLDPAFLRRLRFVVPFPFPDAAARARIWRRAFPPGTPTEDLDVAVLGRLSISGGTIANIALAAAYLAADVGQPVRMAHLLAATRTEYAKLERPLTTAEVTGWTT